MALGHGPPGGAHDRGAHRGAEAVLRRLVLDSLALAALLPEAPTIVVLVVPAKRGLDVLEDCAERGLHNVWVQPGAFSAELMESLDRHDFDWLAEACVMVRARTAIA